MLVLDFNEGLIKLEVTKCLTKGLAYIALSRSIIIFFLDFIKDVFNTMK